MKCLITGGAGFIGSNLANHLSLNHEVTVVDNLSEGKIEFIPNINLIQDDFASDNVLNKIKNKEFDYVFHLAAQPKVSYSVEHPSETTDTNVNKTVKLLEACRSNIKRFINTSSSAVYNEKSAHEGSNEKMLLSPKSPYALQKLVTEQYCSLFSEIYDLDTVSIRPFNVFGPNQMGKSSYSCVISAWMHCAKHKLPLRFDGNGMQQRDFIYVDNVVNVFTAAAFHDSPFKGDIFNAGTGLPIALYSIAGVFRMNFPKLTFDYAKARPNDVTITNASTKRTQNILKVFQKISFEEGFQKTKDWTFNSPLF